MRKPYREEHRTVRHHAGRPFPFSIALKPYLEEAGSAYKLFLERDTERDFRIKDARIWFRTAEQAELYRDCVFEHEFMDAMNND